MQNSAARSFDEDAYGTGRVYRRGSIWWIDYYVNGRRCRMSSGSRDRDKALAMLREKIDARSHGRYTGIRRGEVVYFLHNPATGLVKIGRTVNLKGRIRTLETAAGCELTLLGTIAIHDMERAWHDRCADLRRVGEWFTATPELLDLIRTSTR